MSTAALTSLLRQWLARQALAPPPSSPVKAALDHRLAGTLYHIKAPLGESDTLVCRSAWADQLGAHLLRVEALSRIWPREAPPPLIFKGADLAENLYNDPGARQARDLDLLVPPSAFDGLVRHLARSADQLERPRHERFAHDREHAVGLRFGPLLIEVHAHPWPPHRGGPDGWCVWSRGVAGRLGDLPVLFPCPADRLLLWLGNMSKGAFLSDLGDLLDFVLISRRWTSRGEADALGLGLALDVAQARLRLSGLAEGADAAIPGLNRWLPPPDAARASLPRLRAQVLKTWLAAPGARPAIVARLVASWLRDPLQKKL